MNILIILTCFNRKKLTEKCIKSLSKGNKNLKFTFIVVDDNSKDGTIEMLEALRKDYNLYIIKGSGNLYYSGGMRIGMDYALNNLEESFDYFLMVNDDVEFFENSIEKMISQIQINKSVIVGATCDDRKQLTYGAIKYVKNNSIKYRNVDITEHDLECDTFNANCVLIPYSVLKEIGSIDPKYMHSLGDFDYGLKISNAGYRISSSQNYIGLCYKNSVKGTWQDNSLGFFKRVKIKETPKGAPIKEWHYFLKKNFGTLVALRHSFTPFLRIILAR